MLLVSWHLAAQGEQVNATDKSFTEFGPPESSGQPQQLAGGSARFRRGESRSDCAGLRSAVRPAREILDRRYRETAAYHYSTRFGGWPASRGAAAECGFRLHRPHQRLVHTGGTGAIHSDRLQPIARRILGPGRQPQPITTMVDRPEEGRGSRRVNAMRLVPQGLRGTDRTGVAGAVPRFRYEPAVGTARAATCGRRCCGRGEPYAGARSSKCTRDPRVDMRMTASSSRRCGTPLKTRRPVSGDELMTARTGAPRRRDGVITHPERAEASSRSMCVSTGSTEHTNELCDGGHAGRIEDEQHVITGRYNISTGRQRDRQGLAGLGKGQIQESLI